MHSATKYLGGHSDVVAGALVVKDEELAEKFISIICRRILGPQDSYLVCVALKLCTCVCKDIVKTEESCRIFIKHPKSERFLSGLEDHPNQVAKMEMRDFGGMVSFNFKSGERKDADAFFKS